MSSEINEALSHIIRILLKAESDIAADIFYFWDTMHGVVVVSLVQSLARCRITS